jgi:hypothetical protein
MAWLGDWQLRRALSGNELSWAYTFEWPLFAGFAVYFWARTVREELHTAAGAGAAAGAKAAPGADAGPRANAAAGVDAGPGAKAAAGADASPDGAAAASEGRSAPPGRQPGEAYLARLKAEVRGHGKWHGLR